MGQMCLSLFSDRKTAQGASEQRECELLLPDSTIAHTVSGLTSLS